jgi:hypothetical protein
MPAPKKIGKFGWHMSKEQVKWFKRFIKVGVSLNAKRRAIARREFIKNNPQPVFAVG